MKLDELVSVEGFDEFSFVAGSFGTDVVVDFVHEVDLLVHDSSHDFVFIEDFGLGDWVPVGV